MQITECLNQIRSIWLSRTSERLAKGEGVRESFLGQLNRFYDLLLQAVETGDQETLKPLLTEWLQARTETEVEHLEGSISPILNQILLITYDVIQESLDTEDALMTIGEILPIYTRSIDFTSFEETKLHIQHVTDQLDKARLTLEKLEKSKSDFISIAAHELKTPLTLIEGYASMIQEVLPKSDFELPAGLYINGIKAGTTRLREIVDDMIDVSLIDNNLLSLNFQPIWLNRLINLVRRELNESLSLRKLSLTINQFDGGDEMIFGDGERLYQAFRNLISNAVKYTPDGGSITVDGRRLPGFIEVIISDTGIGIDPEDHVRIFNKFGRLGDVSLHSSGKTKFKGGGPGLGLPITRGIVDAHGGAIWVESEGFNEETCPGSTFHVLLPIRKSPPDDKIAKFFHTLTNSPAAADGKKNT
jgi:signal transduction histidine kinase